MSPFLLNIEDLMEGADSSKYKETNFKKVCRPYGVCHSCAAAPRLNYFSYFTAGLRPRLTQMSPLRGWLDPKCDDLFHRLARIAATTQTPTGLGEFSHFTQHSACGCVLG